MRKLFTLLVLLTAALTASAKDFTDSLFVTVSGQTTKSIATVSLVKQTNDKYTLTLDNFKYGSMNVGKIEITDIEPTDEGGGVTGLSASKDVTIQKGSDPSVWLWMGPIIGSVPINLTGKTDDQHLFAVINITANIMGSALEIHVEFGKETSIATSISNVQLQSKAEVSAIYDTSGAEVQSMKAGNIYIIRYNDGTKKKVLCKE